MDSHCYTGTVFYLPLRTSLYPHALPESEQYESCWMGDTPTRAAIGQLSIPYWNPGNLCISPRFERAGLESRRKRSISNAALAAEGISNTCVDLP